jgi:hypothetical protein
MYEIEYIGVLYEILKELSYGKFENKCCNSVDT